MTVRQGGLTVDWLGYATARIECPDGTVAYTDPGRYGVLTGEWTSGEFETGAAHPASRDYRAEDADLVVVTRDHFEEPLETVEVTDADSAIAGGAQAAGLS